MSATNTAVDNGVNVAALLEAFWSSKAVIPAAVKFAIGGVLWTAVAAYFGIAGRRARPTSKGAA